MEKLDMSEMMELLTKQTFVAMFEAMDHIGTTLNDVVDWINEHDQAGGEHDPK